jgi:hypothetical protein
MIKNPTERFSKDSFLVAAGLAGVVALAVTLPHMIQDETRVDCTVNNGPILLDNERSVAQSESGPQTIPRVEGNHAIFSGILRSTCDLIEGAA